MPRDLPPVVRKRIETNVVRSEVLPVPGGSARFVARRIPGQDGLRWWARLEDGTPTPPRSAPRSRRPRVSSPPSTRRRTQRGALPCGLVRAPGDLRRDDLADPAGEILDLGLEHAGGGLHRLASGETACHADDRLVPLATGPGAQDVTGCATDRNENFIGPP